MIPRGPHRTADSRCMRSQAPCSRQLEQVVSDRLRLGDPARSTIARERCLPRQPLSWLSAALRFASSINLISQAETEEPDKYIGLSSFTPAFFGNLSRRQSPSAGDAPHYSSPATPTTAWRSDCFQD